MRRFLPLFLLLISVAFSAIIAGTSSVGGDSILGVWMDASNQTKIRVYKSNNKYYAKLLWVENESHPGKPLCAEHQRWINMTVMHDFKWTGKEWSDGYIYQPKTDKTYTAFITPINANKMAVTGYVLLRVLSESAYFHRVGN
jgi:uncharacterized protein (DUF2147 family)